MLLPDFSTTRRAIKSAVALVLCASCSVTVPRSTVSFVNEETMETQLWPVISDENDNYKLSVSALGNIDDALIFQVDVTNKILDSLVIDPSLWQLYPVTPAENGWTTLDTIQTMNTQEIAAVYSQLADKIQEAQNKETAAKIIVGVVLIVGLLVLASEMDQKARKNNNNRDYYANNYVSSSVNLSFNAIAPVRFDRRIGPKDRIYQMREESDKFKGFNQEPISLLPGEDVSFDVYFQRLADMNNFKLTWNLNGEQYEWYFNHAINGDKPQDMLGIPSGLE